MKKLVIALLTSVVISQGTMAADSVDHSGQASIVYWPVWKVLLQRLR